MSETVCAVVVTYNRKELLRECLQAIRAQTRRPDHVLVVDNASQDGTPEMLRDEFPEVEVLRLPANQGGAGGFHEGMKRGYEKGFGWLWLMDDDTLPAEDALATLESACQVLLERVGKPLILASRVVWVDGSLHPMNLPAVKTSDYPLLVKGVEMGFLSIRSASFVSLLVHREAIEHYGLPVKDYFIWYDDVEYTARILRDRPGFLVPGSVVTHKTRHKCSAFDRSTPSERFYYAVRNGFWMILRSDAWTPKEKVKLSQILIWDIGRFVYGKRFAVHALYHVLRGLKDGLLRAPRRP